MHTQQVVINPSFNKHSTRLSSTSKICSGGSESGDSSAGIERGIPRCKYMHENIVRDIIETQWERDHKIQQTLKLKIIISWVSKAIRV